MKGTGFCWDKKKISQKKKILLPKWARVQRTTIYLKQA